MKFTHIFINEASGELMAENFDKNVAGYQLHRYCYDITANFNSMNEARRRSVAVLIGNHAEVFNSGDLTDRDRLVRELFITPTANYEDWYIDFEQAREVVRQEDQYGL